MIRCILSLTNNYHSGVPSEESPVVEKDNTFSGSTLDDKTSHNNVR